MIRAAVARIWGQETANFVGKRFPDCSRCRLPQHEQDRERWGCDRPSDRPVFEIGCGTCHGKDMACPRCEGRGVIDMYRCPSQVVNDAPPHQRLQVDLLMRSYLQLEARHVLPVGGGLLDQTRSFVSALELIDAERARLESIKEEKRERDRQARERSMSSPRPRRR